MGLQITVRGVAEEHHPAERAVVELTAAVEGSDREAVLVDAQAVQEPMVDQLRSLADRDGVASWWSDQLRVMTHRPWEDGKQSAEPVHTVRLQLTADFRDFERLSGFLGHWAGREGVEVRGIRWDLTPKNRRLYEAEARKAAVDDAVLKAQAYSDAVRRGRVTAVELSDPGILDGGPGGEPPVTMALASARSAGAETAPLALEPEEIVVRVEVDARFRAE